MTATPTRQRTWIAVAVAAALVVVPMFAMGFGAMGMGHTMAGDWGHSHWMWGASDGPSPWMLVVGVGMQLLFLALLVGAGYLGYRELTSSAGSTDPALEELRTAYARGDLDDEEFERRRERLEAGE